MTDADSSVPKGRRGLSESSTLINKSTDANLALKACSIPNLDPHSDGEGLLEG